MLIGIDGGASRSRCVITDVELNIISESNGDQINPLVIGFDQSVQNIIHLISDTLKSAKSSERKIKSVVIGSAGCGREDDANQLKQLLFKLLQENNITVDNLLVTSDARITLEAAFEGKPGSILISGTGSIMLGKNDFGEIFRVGGLGRLIGDEGSGYSIGKKGLTAIAKYFDGRGKSTKLTDIIEQEFLINSVDGLITALYKNNFNIPALAPVVFDAAESGDVTAQKILEEEADELILHIASMKELIKSDLLKLSLYGSLLTKPNYFSYLLNEKIIRKFNDVRIVEPINLPEFGAIIMAKRLLD